MAVVTMSLCKLHLNLIDVHNGQPWRQYQQVLKPTIGKRLSTNLNKAAIQYIVQSRTWESLKLRPESHSALVSSQY
jgi:hypothetical protein